MLATLVLGLSATILHAPAAALGKGPRTEALTITYYRNITWAYLALKSGEIDAVGYELPKELYYDAVADPNLVLAPVDDFGMYEFDLNNNATIASALGYRSPMNYVALRRATALLTDKNYIVDTICGGFAARIDAAVAAPIKEWANQSYWYPHYPWEYNPAQAALVLDTTFPQGTTPNPYYHSSFPGSAAYLRTYPAGHAKAGQDLDPLIVCVRTDDPRRLQAGRLVYGNLRKHGIPVNALEGRSAALYDRVFGDMNYHLYTGGWSMTYWPVGGFYSLYHSHSYYPYGSNYVTGFEHPQLDAYLELARYPANASEARRGVQLVTGYMTEQCVTIPLFGARAFWAWRTDLLGVVNMHGYGPENPYTFLNAYKPDGAAIRYGLKAAPVALNIIYSQWYYDYQSLDRMNLYGGVISPPYDLSLDQPAFVTTRLVGTWDDGGTTKSKGTYTYRPDAYFVEPVTGNQLANVNASHVYASIWYHYQTGDGWFYPYVCGVHHLNVTGPYTLDIYFDWYWYWEVILYAQPPIVSFHLLQQPPLSACRSEDFTAATADAFLGLTHPVYWVDRLYDDAGPLTRGTDWELMITGPDWYDYVDVYIYAGVNLTGTVHVDYWSAEDADGYTPGNLPWAIALEGAGAWYATNFTAGVGGNLTLHRNPYYVETPLLGEIDWVRKPNGGFKIDIYDVVLAAGAYGSHGTGVPDAHWLAGADVAPPGGVIDIYDIVTITGKYGQEFDLPP
jgi:hypothetical protein